MRQDISIVDGRVLVTLIGSLYVEEAAVLRKKLIELLTQNYKNFIVDIGQIDYIDSSGLGVLVGIQKRALEKGGGVVIKGLHGTIKELFELTRLTKVFEIQPERS